MFNSIPQNHVALIQRFGKYTRVQKAGLRFRFPFIEKTKYLHEWQGIATKKNYLIELSEQQSDTAPRQCQTRDNVTIEADASVYWKIIDPINAVYNIDILPKVISDVSLNSLRANIGKLTLNEILTSREQLNHAIAEDLKQTSKNWGVKFTRVELQEINYSKEIEETMLQEMAAERKSKAIISESEGTAKAIIAKAEAEAKATEIQAKAKAEALNILAKSEELYLKKLKSELSSKEAMEIILAHKQLEGLSVISNTTNSKIYIPGSINTITPHKTIDF